MRAAAPRLSSASGRVDLTAFEGNATRMPVRPFLSSQAFEPETIREMSLALEKVCDALSLKMVDDAATRLIAEKIVELAQRGVHDVAALTSMTLQEIRRDGRQGRRRCCSRRLA
jgi:hypothetical protein